MTATSVDTGDTSTKGQLGPLAAVAILGFAILLSYGLARSAIDSLILQDHGKEAMKYAYGLVAISVAIVVGFYSKAAASRPIGSLTLHSANISAALLALLLGARMLEIPYAAYALYIWKDVYVVVLVELLWTLANSAFKQNTAKWAYGFFCVAGSLGDMAGSMSAKHLATEIGSAELLWLIVPILIASGFLGLVAARACGWPMPKDKGNMHGVVAAVRESRSIQLLLATVAVIQIVTTLIDYNYRVTAYDAYPLLDARTAAFGNVDFLISVFSTALQLLSGAFVTVLGIRIIIFLIPLVVGGAAAYYAVHPAFASVAILKVANKALDYSLFRTTKELLYRPLSYQEKTQGKAAVDVFGYRVAKGGASALLILLTGALPLIAMLSGVLLWLVLAALLVRVHDNLALA